MIGALLLKDQGPFHLPAAQCATATGHENNGVTMTVYCLLPKREKGVLVYCGMGPEAVSELGEVSFELAQWRR
jgi:hypothetical protein